MARKKPTTTHIPKLMPRAWRDPERPVIPEEFEDKTWIDFDPRLNLEIILDPRASFPGHRAAVFAAWRAWLLMGDHPQAETILENSVAISAAATLIDAESRAQKTILKTVKQEEDSQFLVHALSRFAEVSPHFYREIYDPIGGTRRLLQTPDSRSHRRELRDLTRGLRYAVALARILHWVTETPGLVPASINVASTLPFALNLFPDEGSPPAERLVREYWSRWRSQIPLLYALYSLPSLSSDEGQGCLGDLMAYRAGLKQMAAIGPDLLGRANYFFTSILGGLSTRNRRLPFERNFPETEAVPFRPPPFSDDQSQKIRSFFAATQKG